MKTPARLLFGVRTSAEVVLSVAVDGPPPPPLELLIRSASGESRAIVGAGTTWSATLAAGDHVIHLPVADSAWFSAPLSFSLSAPATIVVIGELQGKPLVSWTSDVGVMADPKNPWPPPQNSPLVYELAGAGWMVDTLAALRAKISLDRHVSTAAPGPSSSPSRSPGVRSL